jgi:hypothetical protein
VYVGFYSPRCVLYCGPLSRSENQEAVRYRDGIRSRYSYYYCTATSTGRTTRQLARRTVLMEQGADVDIIIVIAFSLFVQSFSHTVTSKYPS